MTASQRAALIDLMDAILACDCAPAGMQNRAHALRFKLAVGAMLGDIFG